jgi:hypothetical protein
MRPGLGLGLSRDGPDAAGEFRSGSQPRELGRPHSSDSPIFQAQALLQNRYPGYVVLQLINE